jgi:hypothetical protein
MGSAECDRPFDNVATQRFALLNSHRRPAPGRRDDYTQDGRSRLIKAFQLARGDLGHKPADPDDQPWRWS